MKNDITVLPAIDDDPKKLRLGWVVYESCGDIREETRDRLNDEEFNKWEYENSPLRNLETDRANSYLSHHGMPYVKPDSISHTSIKVLQFLYGLPWNNLALNYVHSLRPSCIRVTEDCVTCDAYNWRVTVYINNLKI